MSIGHTQDFSIVKNTDKTMISFCKTVKNQLMMPIELFAGFNDFKILTYSGGISLIEELFKTYDYTSGVVILGTQKTLHSQQAASAAVSSLVNSQAYVQNYILKSTALQDKIENGDFQFYVMDVLTDHRKTYILTNTETGHCRIILGSANASNQAWNMSQGENYEVFDNDELAYELQYQKNFLTSLELCSPVDVKAKEIKKDLSNITELPTFKKVVNYNTSIVIDKREDNVEYGTAFLGTGMTKEFETIIKEANIVNKEGTGILITGKNCKRLHALISKKNEEEKQKERVYTRFKIDYEMHHVSLNGQEWNLNPVKEEIASDVNKLVQYMNGFDVFTGDTEKLKEDYAKVLNYMFAGPFMAKLRCVAYNYSPDTLSFPLYLIINGRQNAGKTEQIRTIKKLMFNLDETTLKRDVLEESIFTASATHELKCNIQGFPIFIDEMSPKYFQYAKNIMKTDDHLAEHGYDNLPYFVILSNDLTAIKGDLTKRSVFFSIHNQISTEKNTEEHKREVVSLRRGMKNAFYREYLRRMLPVLDDMIERIMNDKIVDIFAESSKVICDIIQEYTDRPAFFRVYSKEDYLGSKSVSRRATQWLEEIVNNNPGMISIDKKRRRLKIDFSGMDTNTSKSTMKMLLEELPPDILGEQAGNILTMDLDFIRKYTGLSFTKKVWPFRR